MPTPGPRGKGLRQVFSADADLVAFLVGQVFPARLGVLLDRIAPLLDLFVEYRQDLGVVQFDPLVHLPLLDRGEYEANDAEPALVGRLHRGLHVILDPLLEHGGGNLWS